MAREARTLDDLIARLRERTSDPKRRTDAPQSISMSGPGGTLTTMFGSVAPGAPGPLSGGRPLSIGGLVEDLRRVVDANRTDRPIDPAITRRVAAMRASLTTENITGLPPPADGAALDRAERHLGFVLPADLRRVYAEVADGGFGPGGGLLSIERVVDTYLELRADSPGPRGQTWPERLLPLIDREPGYDCLDAIGGSIVGWDPEGLSERSGRLAWHRSFEEISSSLLSWLDAWVGSRPQHEVLQERVNASLIEEARTARASIGAKTLEERRAMGLPDVGWERVVWGGLGLEEDEQAAE